MTGWLLSVQDFHFLRPVWFTALIPAVIAGLLIYRRQANSGSWSKVIAPELIPYLIDTPANSQRRNHSYLWLAGWLIGVIGLAGPAFEQTPLPVHKQQGALVVAFDLSPSMLAEDLTPSRLDRARLKLIDLLNARKEGATGLVAYGGDAFVVSPLTDDAHTIAALVPALSPDIIPSQGSNVESAVEKAVELTINAGHATGDILLMTDGISDQGRDSLQVILRSMGGFRLFVLGIGTEQGAPIPLQGGGFAKDSRGNILVPKLNHQKLRKLAEQNNGSYYALTADDSDIEFLNNQFNETSIDSSQQLERYFDTWRDLGYWAALALIPLLLLIFRKGLVVGLLIAAGLGTYPQPSQAFEFQDLWLTPDQQAARAMAEQDAGKAEQLFENPQWKGAAAYRNNNFEAAKELFSGQSADELYNRGNALAKAGELEAAVEAYQQALAKSPEMEDAMHNKQLLEELLNQQQNQQDQQNNQQQDQQQDQNSEQENSGNSGQQNQNQDGEPSDSDPERQQDPKANSDQQSSQQSEQEPQPDDAQANEDSQADNENQAGGQEQEQQEQKQQQEQQGQEQEQQDQPPDAKSGAQKAAEKPLSNEEEQAVEQWLRRIPDDPGGLLRRKFEAEAEKRRQQRRWGGKPPADNDQQRW